MTLFVWLPLSRNLFPTGHVLAPYIPMVIATLVAIPISSAISLHSAKPIQGLVEATKSISKGDFSVRVSEEGEGDIGELLHSFNQMTAELGSTELMRKLPASLYGYGMRESASALSISDIFSINFIRRTPHIPLWEMDWGFLLCTGLYN